MINLVKKLLPWHNFAAYSTMNPQTSSTPKQSNRAEWFDHLIAALRTHELQLETDTAPDELKKTYDLLMGNDIDEVLKMNKQTIQKHFVGKIIIDFLKLLDKNLPAKLAFDFNDSEVLVWAEIEDNNEEQEKLLTRTESKINAQYHPFGFDMEAMIVEKSDALPIPNHYKVFKV